MFSEQNVIKPKIWSGLHFYESFPDDAGKTLGQLYLVQLEERTQHISVSDPGENRSGSCEAVGINLSQRFAKRAKN
jgi:hypothetical protein